MDLKKLGKDPDGKLTLDGKVVKEAEEIGNITIEEPLLNIYSSRGNYNPLECRKQQIPPGAEAYYMEEVASVIKNPFEVGIEDYKIFKIEFYRNIKL